jgi:hypothetical protein
MAGLVVHDLHERPQVRRHGHFLGGFVGRFGEADDDFFGEDIGMCIVLHHGADPATVADTLSHEELDVHQRLVSVVGMRRQTLDTLQVLRHLIHLHLHPGALFRAGRTSPVIPECAP